MGQVKVYVVHDVGDPMAHLDHYWEVYRIFSTRAKAEAWVAERETPGWTYRISEMTVDEDDGEA